MPENLDSIKNKINLIREMDLKLESPEAVVSALRKLIFPTNYRTVGFPRVSTVYRARNVEADNIRKIGYPDRKYVKKMGRCNYADQPLFYCAADKVTPVIEMRPIKNQIFTISEWKIDDHAQLDIVGFGFPNDAIFEFPSGDKVKCGERKKNILKQDKTLSHLNLTEESNDAIDNFLNEEFRKRTDDPDLYKITAALANIYLFNQDNVPIHGVCYPSIATYPTGLNFAYLPEVVDKYFSPRMFFKIKIVEEPKPEEYKISQLAWANNYDYYGNINWQKL